MKRETKTGLRGRESGPYDDPRLHDLLYAPGTAGEVRGLVAIARRHLPPRSARLTWLEPACGTGRYLRHIAARGDHVLGFDRNSAFLEYARRRLARYGRRVRLFEADMESFAESLRPASVDLAFNLDNTIRHLESDAALARHLREMKLVLEPAGIYAVGLSLARYGTEEITEDFWTATRGRTRVELLVQYFPPGTLGPSESRWEDVIQHRVVTRRAGGGNAKEAGRAEEATHADFRYRLRCYDRAQWQRAVRRAGFETIAAVDASGQPIDPEAFDYAIHLLRPRQMHTRLSSVPPAGKTYSDRHALSARR